MIASCINPALAKYAGKRLNEIATLMGKNPGDALLDLVESDRGQTLVVRFLASDDDVRLGLSQPWVSLCTDAPGQAIDGPFAGWETHPRAFGSMPRALGMYVREQHLVPLEELVRKMTSLPARRVGLMNRGLLRPGMAADVVVFDPATVRDVATYEEPLRFSEGIDSVVVNGKLVLDAGKLTAERPGQILRHTPKH